MKQFLYIVAAFLAGCIVTSILFTEQKARQAAEPTVVTQTIYDTLPYPYPVPRDSVVLRYETKLLPIDKPLHIGEEENFITKTDSVNVVIPITQIEYADSTYHAWVSGYSAKLDSIYVFPRHDITTIIQPAPKPKRWSIGINAGYGITPTGAQPYIGIGVSYSLFSF